MNWYNDMNPSDRIEDVVKDVMSKVCSGEWKADVRGRIKAFMQDEEASGILSQWSQDQGDKWPIVDRLARLYLASHPEDAPDRRSWSKEHHPESETNWPN
jgi:hypothetical protein